MAKLTTLTQIHKLEERYPFNEEELEILIRCYDNIRDTPGQGGGFLEKLALSSPYTYFFLPGDEMHSRVAWIENHILPMGFPNKFRAAISADAFVNYANEGQEKNLERFLEGIADTGRRGVKEALKVLYDIVGDDRIEAAEELLDLVFRLSVAADAFVVPNLEKAMYLNRLEGIEAKIDPMVKSLKNFCLHKKTGDLSRKVFVEWAENNVPLLSAPLSTFVHRLIFRDSPYPVARIPYKHPHLDHESAIFTAFDCPSLFALSLTSRYFHGKMHRLYSTDVDGTSFNCLEFALLGYDGPSLVIVKTQKKELIGAFAQGTWKDSIHYHGGSDCFLFQLQPIFNVLMATGENDGHFMYLHSSSWSQAALEGLPYGIGFGGSTFTKPRLFIPESLEHCTAGFMDSTYQSGSVLPEKDMEQFEISCLEVWGVGDEIMIQHALKLREAYRVYQADFLKKVRTIEDKTQFLGDLTAGPTPSKLYKHREEARGRHDFAVDDKHGGYKIDRE